MLLKSPYVTLAGVLSLALGIGATTGIFSIYYQILLRPLPVPQPDELVNFVSPGPKPGSESCGAAGECEAVFSYPMFRDLEHEQTPFVEIAGHVGFGANLAANGTTTTGRGMLVSGSYFPLLQLQPALGRLLGPDDDSAPGESAVAVLSHDFWRSRFAESPAVLNQVLTINGRPLTIVGVAPKGFTGTTLQLKADVFVPITMRDLMQPSPNGDGDIFTSRQTHWIYLFARVKPGFGVASAQSAINGPFHNIITQVEAPTIREFSPRSLEEFKARKIELQDGSRGQTVLHRNARAPLMLLFAVTALVLMVVCANLANLFLARSAGRAAEISIRASIGASRYQLLRQLLTEASLLAGLGGIGALFVARWTLDLVLAIAPEAADAVTATLDLQSFIFAAAVTMAVALAFGLLPALRMTRLESLSSVRTHAASFGDRATSRFRFALVTFQIALSLALLSSAGLFVQSLLNVSRIDVGVNFENVLVFGVSPRLNGYTSTRSRALFERLEQELAAIPGVKGVGGARVAILIGDNFGLRVYPEGFRDGPGVNRQSNWNVIGPNYFSTLGIRIKAGRDFTPSDTAGQPKVAMVNEAFVTKFNLGPNPIGKRMTTNSPDSPLDIEIVGLVEDSKYGSVKQTIPPVFYQPYRQNDGIGSLYFYVRTALSPEQLIPDVTSIVKRLDPNLPVESPVPMLRHVQAGTVGDRLLAILSGSFAILATLIAAIGLYGVLAYTVAQRTREIGLRMAIGAQRWQVQSMILREVGKMMLLGGTLGVVAASGLGRLVQSLLFELQGNQPYILLAAAFLLGLVVFFAGLIPAYRASRVNPIEALRYE